MLSTSKSTQVQMPTDWLERAKACGSYRPEDENFYKRITAVGELINSGNLPVADLVIEKLRDPEEQPSITIYLKRGTELSEIQKQEIGRAAGEFRVWYISIESQEFSNGPFDQLRAASR